MDSKKAAKKGAERVKDLADHVERLAANVITGDATQHLSRAGNELVSAINKTVEDMSIPEDAKKHLLTAEKETIMAMKSVLDAVIKEIERIEKPGKKPVEKLKKIKIK